MELRLQSYLSIKDLSKIRDIIFNYQKFKETSSTLNSDLFCIIENISTDTSKYSIDLAIVSNKSTISTQIKDYNKVFSILCKNEYIDEIDLNIKLEYITVFGKGKKPYLRANIYFTIT